MEQVRKSIHTVEKLYQHGAVDKTITLIDATLLRPIPMTWACTLSLIGTGYIYGIGRQNGFMLSGSELWIFFCGGWIIGVVSEALATLIHTLIIRR